MGKVIYADGKEEIITDVSLGILQKIVKGYIEVMRIRDFNQEYSFMIVNEEALQLKLPKNQKATELSHKFGLDQSYNISKEGILGNVVLLTKEEFK